MVISFIYATIMTSGLGAVEVVVFVVNAIVLRCDVKL